MSQDTKNRSWSPTTFGLLAAALLVSGLLLALPPNTTTKLDPTVWSTPAAAATTDKPQVLFFTADWCGPCQNFKQNVLSRDEVSQTLTAKATPVLVDLTASGSEGQTAEKLANQYRVNAIPTTILVSAQGEPISRFTGGHTTTQFINWFNKSMEASSSNE
ncbi:thioredoxin family protein [Mucisphaera sp.]|uniref:thioredoxin family protein n=1 Tax=Mucisphaera sp. TaxID=2913024 RepID=UPI003D0B7650